MYIHTIIIVIIIRIYIYIMREPRSLVSQGAIVTSVPSIGQMGSRCTTVHVPLCHGRVSATGFTRHPPRGRIRREERRTTGTAEHRPPVSKHV